MFKKILIVMLIFVIVAGIGAGYFFLYQEKEKEIRLRKDMETTLNLALEDKENIKQELDKIRDDYQKVSQELEDKIVKNKALSKEVGDITINLSGAKSEIEILSQERDVLLKRFEEQQSKLDEYKKGFKDKSSLVRIAPFAEEDKVKLDNITVVEEVVDKKEALSKIKVAQIEAEIMAFNKEYGFIVLNKGAKDGVDIDSVYVFSVQGQTQGKLQPDRVYESMSVLDILEGRENIAEGMTIDILPEEE